MWLLNSMATHGHNGFVGVGGGAPIECAGSQGAPWVRSLFSEMLKERCCIICSVL